MWRNHSLKMALNAKIAVTTITTKILAINKLKIITKKTLI